MQWDRNHDGDISRQEFRLHTRKLGLEAETQSVDDLYDSLDLDGSGSLDIEEMKEALKSMQADVKTVKHNVARVEEFASSMRGVAERFRGAAADTAAVEAARRRLESIREAARDDTTAARLAAAVKSQGKEWSELVKTWDVNGDGIDLETFCREAEAALAEAPPPPGDGSTVVPVAASEISELFTQLDFDCKGVLDAEDLGKQLSLSGMTGVALGQAVKKAEAVQLKVIAHGKKLAESSQKAARASLDELEANQAATEAADKEARQEAAAAEARAKAEEIATKKSRKGSTMLASFMKI